jgi:predicted DNA-binding protein with PD1-like motif
MSERVYVHACVHDREGERASGHIIERCVSE